MSAIRDLVRRLPGRLALPIAVFPGLSITGAKVRDIVTNPVAQFEASAALHARFGTPVVLSAMDLSVEAEAFGAEIHHADNEIPTVTSALVHSPDEARRLAIPVPGDMRTGVYLEAVRLLHRLPDRPLVLAGCIGPFSLASRLVGVSEAMSLTITDPDWMHLMLDKTAEFLTRYVREFKAAGAGGVIMAEPSAGLLSPRSMVAFSSSYIACIREAVEDERFSVILHNCAAKSVHLKALFESGAKVFHFGAPMDLPAALSAAPANVVVCGNLDPTQVFHQSTPDEVSRRTRELLQSTHGFKNHVPSSGCDVPHGSPLANLDAFFGAVRDWGAGP